jgi:hypothetical protein
MAEAKLEQVRLNRSKKKYQSVLDDLERIRQQKSALKSTSCIGQRILEA